MLNRQRGFTVIELMIVVLIVGILVSIVLPNYVEMLDRAREGSTKANMHAFQLACEDFGVENDGTYPPSAVLVAIYLPQNGAVFINPFSGGTGQDVAWEARAAVADSCSHTPGIVSYADSVGLKYNIKGYGASSELRLVLSSWE